jgi:SAM-dependent methyltransferase
VYAGRERVDLFRTYVGGPGRRVLDLGCRYGALTQAYAGGNDVVGVDVDREALAEAAKLGIETRWADVDEPLPFEDGSFDVVVSNSTLDHFPSLDDVESAVRELQRVLAPAGLLIVTLDNLRNPLVSLRNALPYPLLHRLGLVPYYVGATCGPRRLQRLLEAAGFGVEELAALLHVPRVLARALRLPVRVLLAGERLGHAPTRFVTGQFVAARARKP